LPSAHKILDASSPRVIYGVRCLSAPAPSTPSPSSSSPAGIDSSAAFWQHPCIGSFGAGAGTCSPPRPPCICSFGAGAGRCPTCVCVYYCSTYYKTVCVGGRAIVERGRVLRETTSRGLCGLVCPSCTSERGGERDCVKEGGGKEGERERERALGPVRKPVL
jgi:hypothetical protein